MVDYWLIIDYLDHPFNDILWIKLYPIFIIKIPDKNSTRVFGKNGPAPGLGIRKISGISFCRSFFVHGSVSDRQPVAMMKLVDSKSTKKHPRLCDKWCWYIYIYSHPQIDGKVNHHQICRDLLFHLFGDNYMCFWPRKLGDLFCSGQCCKVPGFQAFFFATSGLTKTTTLRHVCCYSDLACYSNIKWRWNTVGIHI